MEATGTITAKETKFTGGVFPVFLFFLWCPLLLLVTLCLALPLVECIVIRWVCDHSIISGKRYKFKGTAGGLFGRYILWWFLTIITLGIYGFWSIRNQIRWMVENIEMVD